MRSATLVIAFCVASISLASEAPAAYAENGSPRIEILSRSECCPAEVRFQVEGSDGGETYSAEGLFTYVHEVERVASGRFLVIGELNHGGDAIAVVDGDSGEQELEMWAYGFSVSPEGRRLVYSTHYPRLGPPEARRSIVLLYDLTATPGENRRGAAQRDWPEHNDGRPIFPLENACTHAYDLFLTTPPFLVTSPFLWSSDGTRLVFFTMREDRSEPALVRIDVTAGGCAGSASLSLDLASMLQCPSLEDRALVFAPEGLNWADDEETMVQARLRGPCPFGDAQTFVVP